jgi:hypothetical protein
LGVEKLDGGEMAQKNRAARKTADKSSEENFDLVFRELSGQIGEALEAGLSLAMKQAQGAISIVVQRMVADAEGGTPEKAVLNESVAAARMFSKASHIVPPVAGEFTKASSFLVMSTGLKLLRAFNREMRALR